MEPKSHTPEGPLTEEVSLKAIWPNPKSQLSLRRQREQQAHTLPMNLEFCFVDEPISLTRYEAFKRKKPLVKFNLIRAARELIKRIGGCDIHSAYWFAKKHYNSHCSRNWLPAFAREIAAECDDLRSTFQTRPSRFDGEPRS